MPRRKSRSRSSALQKFRELQHGRIWTPPQRMPTMNNTATWSATVGLAWSPAPAANSWVAQTYRIEDIIKAVCHDLDMTNSWWPLLTIRLHAVQFYHLLDKSTGPIAKELQLGVINPISNAISKSVERVGTIDDECRIAYIYPEPVQETTLSWSGVASVSPRVAVLRTPDAGRVIAYFDVVVTIKATDHGVTEEDMPYPKGSRLFEI